MFWDEFETGRRGPYMLSPLQQQRERAHADAFFRLQILSMLLQQRGEREEELSGDEGEEDGEEEIELLQAQAAFYEEERRHTR